MQTLKQLSSEIGNWAMDNGLVSVRANPEDRPFMGMVEELGELAHARLKAEQGIRGMDDPAAFRAAEQDALADLLIYLLHYCFLRNIDPDRMLCGTWLKVKERNWKKNQEAGS